MRSTIFALVLFCSAALLVNGQTDAGDQIITTTGPEATVVPTTELPLTTISTTTGTGKRQLKGVTIQNSPFAELTDGRITGLVVDLMDGIAGRVPPSAAFNYSLYLSPDGMYGNSFHGRVTGMIGEVVHRRADFAVADLTVTEARSKLVTFSTPFISTHLAALVRKVDVPGPVKTIEDLVKFNAGKPSSLEESPDRVAYGSFTSGATTFKLSQATDEVGGAIYRWLQAHPSFMVPSMKRGLEKVKAGRYAFIVESTFAEHLAGQDCNLTVLADSGKLYERHFAIALPKDSPLVGDFNSAIESMKADGTIEGLKRRYWQNNCKTNDEEDGEKKVEGSSSSSNSTAV